MSTNAHNARRSTLEPRAAASVTQALAAAIWLSHGASEISQDCLAASEDSINTLPQRQLLATSQRRCTIWRAAHCA